MSQAGLNLKYLRKLHSLTQEEFAQKVGIKRSLLGAYEEERAEPRLEVLEKVMQIFRINLEDLVFNNLAESDNSYIAKRRKLKLAADEDSKQIHLVPIKAAAGYLTGYADTEFLSELNTFTLPMLKGSNYRAFEIIGDSMLPTPSGSIIVGQKTESLNDVKTGDAYIVVSKSEGIVYKRIQKNNKQKDKVTLVSDNPNFRPYTIQNVDIVELWRAEMILSKVAQQRYWDINSLAELVSDLSNEVNSMKKKMN